MGHGRGPEEQRGRRCRGHSQQDGERHGFDSQRSVRNFGGRAGRDYGREAQGHREGRHHHGPARLQPAATTATAAATTATAGLRLPAAERTDAVQHAAVLAGGRPPGRGRLQQSGERAATHNAVQCEYHGQHPIMRLGIAGSTRRPHLPRDVLCVCVCVLIL